MLTQNATNHTEKQLANWAEIEAIVGGYHGTPHDILGLHLISADGQGTNGQDTDGQDTDGQDVVVRVFRPLDANVFVKTHESLFQQDFCVFLVLPPVINFQT